MAVGDTPKWIRERKKLNAQIALECMVAEDEKDDRKKENEEWQNCRHGRNHGVKTEEKTAREGSNGEGTGWTAWLTAYMERRRMKTKKVVGWKRRKGGGREEKGGSMMIQLKSAAVHPSSSKRSQKVR
mmetsp:Transcript_8534/g.22801  ORF Transcript_8534/g.22801 Transcript_8534/m.22801 type:complete len:128 (+) Transcript_8534:2427-2810(+)